MGTYNIKEGIELLVDGHAAFNRIIERIRNASQSIYVNMFIWRDDKIGNIIAQEIIDAADRGVKVNIVKDKLGEVFEKAEENKQSFFHKRFNPNLFLTTAAIDLIYPMDGKARNSMQKLSFLADSLSCHSNIFMEKEDIRGDHSKYYIFDGNILIMGGMNIEDKSIYTDVEGKKYKDYMIEMRGNIYVDKFIRRLYREEPFDKESSFEYIFNVKREGKDLFHAKNQILELLSSARESIDIIMAYIGDKDITEKIIECSKRGIRVTMLLPGKANVQHDLNMKILKYIMEKTENNVNVYLSNNMVHAKLIWIDGNIVTFGSMNLNRQAMRKLMELNVLIKNHDETFMESIGNSIQRNMLDGTKIINSWEIKYNPFKALIEQMV